MHKLKKVYPYIISFIISSSMGILFHFLFSLLNKSPFIAWLVPINESIFEHLKLLFYPFMMVSIIELIIRHQPLKNYLPYRILFITISTIILPILYYSFKACIGNVGFINILLYFFCLIIAYLLSFIAEKKQLVPTKSMQLIALATAILLIFIFTLMTFMPPEIEIFRDPIKGTYGF